MMKKHTAHYIFGSSDHVSDHRGQRNLGKLLYLDAYVLCSQHFPLKLNYKITPALNIILGAGAFNYSCLLNRLPNIQFLCPVYSKGKKFPFCLCIPPFQTLFLFQYLCHFLPVIIGNCINSYTDIT